MMSSKSLVERMVDEVAESRQNPVTKSEETSMSAAGNRLAATNDVQSFAAVAAGQVHSILESNGYQVDGLSVTAMANLLKAMNDARRNELKEMELQLQAKKLAIEASSQSGNIFDMWLQGDDD